MEIKYFTVDFWIDSKEYNFLVKLINDHIDNRIFARLYNFKSGKFLQNSWFFNDYDDDFERLAIICGQYLNTSADSQDLAIAEISAEIFENLI